MTISMRFVLLALLAMLIVATILVAHVGVAAAAGSWSFAALMGRIKLDPPTTDE